MPKLVGTLTIEQVHRRIGAERKFLCILEKADSQEVLVGLPAELYPVINDIFNANITDNGNHYPIVIRRAQKANGNYISSVFVGVDETCMMAYRKHITARSMTPSVRTNMKCIKDWLATLCIDEE